jgi:hypothetical protein
VKYSPREESAVSSSRDRPKSATLQTMLSSTNIFRAARSWEEEIDLDGLCGREISSKEPSLEMIRFCKDKSWVKEEGECLGNRAERELRCPSQIFPHKKSGIFCIFVFLCWLYLLDGQSLLKPNISFQTPLHEPC